MDIHYLGLDAARKPPTVWNGPLDDFALTLEEAEAVVETYLKTVVGDPLMPNRLSHAAIVLLDEFGNRNE